MIRLLIAAPSAVLRAGLESLAASTAELQLAGSFPDLALAADLRPDVILAALPWDQIPAPVGGAPIPVVVLSPELAPVWSSDGLRLGVRALLSRNATQAEILAASEAAARGLAVIDPEDLEGLLSTTAPAPVAAEATTLTSRELEVLRMMAEGAANKIIAFKLGISEHTVKFHVAAILSKLNASSRTEAVAIGIRKGLVLL